MENILNNNKSTMIVIIACLLPVFALFSAWPEIAFFKIAIFSALGYGIYKKNNIVRVIVLVWAIARVVLSVYKYLYVFTHFEDFSRALSASGSGIFSPGGLGWSLIGTLISIVIIVLLLKKSVRLQFGKGNQEPSIGRDS